MTDEGDSYFHGRIQGIGDIITYEGADLAEAQVAFTEAVDEYLAWCTERGKEPNKPRYDKLELKGLPENLYLDLAIIASQSAKTLDEMVSDVLLSYTTVKKMQEVSTI